MEMRTLQSELVKKGFIEKAKQEHKHSARSHSKSYQYQEKVESEERRKREIEELMGTRRDRFKRVKGSVRRK